MVQRIYTRTGDEGETGLFGGGRVSKSSSRVRAYGELDELNACIGWTRTQASTSTLSEHLAVVQRDLFALGAHLATAPGPLRAREQLPPLPVERIQELEQWIDESEAKLPELRAFILPGGTPAGAALHLARCVCRRAERAVVELSESEPVEPAILAYLNRLSDLLFVFARRTNFENQQPEEQWQPRRTSE